MMRWLVGALGAMVVMMAPLDRASAEMVLHRGNFSEPETLDPHKSTGEPEAWIQYDLFEGLMTVDAKGKLIHGAAESHTISPDGLTYTFRLRPNGQWSDGTPVTADDFVFSWQRLLDPATASRYAFFLWPVKNAEAVSKGRLPPAELGVSAPDPLTFVVRLEAPTAYFLSALQHHSTYAVSKANVEKFGKDYIRPGNLLSNGAYMLAEAVPQGYVKLVKNPHYYEKDQVKIDTVFFYPTENREAELKRFRSGELHLTYELPDAQLPWVRANMADELRIAPYLSSYYYSINLMHEPWKSSPDLRKALALAVDRDLLVEKITQAGEIPNYHLVPQGVDNYESPTLEWESWTQEQRNEEAKRLMEKAGYGPGGKPLEIEILYNTSENHKKIAVAIASMWQRTLGVRATLINQEWKVFINSRAEKRYEDVTRDGWLGDFDDAYSFLSLMRSDIGEQNYSGYVNPEFDRLIKASAVETDLAKRRELMRQAEAVMLADMPIIPLFTYVSTHMVSRKLKGWEDNVRDIHRSRYMSLEP